MTKKELFNETIEYYRTHQRGVDSYNGRCMYITPENNMCAVGRCMTDEAIKNFLDKYEYDTAITAAGLNKALGLDELDQVLKPEYQGHSVKFWERLQAFHDDSNNWIENDSGGFNLSPMGRSNKDIFLKDFNK